MITKAIVNPDSTIEVGTKEISVNEENNQLNLVSLAVNYVLCTYCQNPYPLPIGAQTFRCQKCNTFNSIKPVNQCALL